MTDDSGFRGLTAAQISERTRQPAEVVEHVLGEEIALGRLELNEGRYRFSRSGWLEIGRHVAVLAPGFVPSAKETGVRW